MSRKKAFLKAEDFQEVMYYLVPSTDPCELAALTLHSTGLLELDKQMGEDPWLTAFAPIRIITAGGFLAVTYLKNRDSTGDIDYLIDPEFAKDKEIQGALQRAINIVSDKLNYEEEWINERMAIFVTSNARQSLFAQAQAQNIYLFKGENLEIPAAPLEWALERKLRRIHSGDRGRKADLDITDAVALLESLRERSGGPLDMESIRRMNLNGFDVLPDIKTMEMIAAEYRAKYNREIFK